MTDPTFIHLRNHSPYSLSEGALHLSDLIDHCIDHNMPAVAVTDTNNLFGAMEFSLKAVKKGVQPILGCQLDIAIGKSRDGRVTSAPIVLLIQNETGFQALSHLISQAYISKDPAADLAVTIDELADYSDGLICLTGGTTGAIGRLITAGKDDLASRLLDRLHDLFDDRLYIELHRHGRKTDDQAEAVFLDMALAHDLPIVATNNCFFGARDFHVAHDALLCIADKAYVSESDRRHETANHYFKSPDEMAELFADLPEAIENTVQIAKRCGYCLSEKPATFPHYETKDNRPESQEMRAQAQAGLEKRLDNFVFTDDMDSDERADLRNIYTERLNHEISIINDMGFPGYFLIVADFIQWAKDQDIPVGPGRGSGGGSVVAWAMNIIDINPVKYDLLFERFLNPDRVSLPDFDIDFCQDRRDEVIGYVKQKYGAEKVAQIITFGKLQARAVLRDVGRVLQMPYGQVDRICKLVPNNPSNPMTLQEAIDHEPILRQMIDDDPTVHRLVNIGLKLEGLYRHASTHAAGLVIGDRPLPQILPLYQDPRSDMPATQFSMKYAEKTGLVKFDFLGLKTLSILKKATDFIARTEGREIDLLSIPMDDEKVFNLMADGNTVGVFQLESAGMQDALKRIKPTEFEDIIAIVSLYRPGPMENIPLYADRKAGVVDIEYPHPVTKEVLEETYGIIVYQEQVMKIAQDLAGYSLAQADILRRAMGKKIQSVMDEQRDVFIDGAVENGVDKDKAVEIFDLMEKFASYGFNKSHAGCYALIAYQTAYLKANYPVEFMAALMCYDMSNTDKLSVFRQDIQSMGIDLLPPDINQSDVYFSVQDIKDASPPWEMDTEDQNDNSNNQDDGGTQAEEEKKYDKAVRYALGAVKGVGIGAMQTVVAERQQHGQYHDFADFIYRMDTSAVNRRQLEILASAGAFDQLDVTRAQAYDMADYATRIAAKHHADQEAGQDSLFGAANGKGDRSGDTGSMPHMELEIPDNITWDPDEQLSHEYDAIGFYLTAHPLDHRMEKLVDRGYLTAENIYTDGRPSANDPTSRAKIAGVIMDINMRSSKRGRYAFVDLSDPTGRLDVTFYTEELNEYAELLEEGAVISAEVNVRRNDDKTRLIVQKVTPVDHAMALGLKEVILDVNGDVKGKTEIQKIHDMLNASDGPSMAKIIFNVRCDGRTIQIRLNRKFPISAPFLEGVAQIDGIDQVIAN